jgi:hypothetical protein
MRGPLETAGLLFWARGRALAGDLRGGFRICVIIEDGWRAWQSARFAAGPLRLARKGARSTSPAFRLRSASFGGQVGEGGRGVWSSTSEAGGGGSMRSIETEGAAGAKRQRISITLAHELRRAQTCEVFEVGEHRDESADAGEEFGKGFRAAWPVEARALAHPEAHLRDLAGAAADGEMQRGLIVDDHRLQVHPRLRAVRERVETIRAERLAHQVCHLLLQRPHALTHRVVRE